MLRWRAYYADGVTRDSARHTWASLSDGVLGVVEFHDPPYRTIHAGYDWIWLQDGELHRTETMWDGWLPRPDSECASCVKRGRAVEDREWADVYKRMYEDRKWPR